MDLEQKYELGEVVAKDAESKTFRAREIASGREVMVHLLFGGKGPGGQEPLLATLLQRVVDPSPEKRQQILEISDYKGMPYAVTQVFPGFTGLRAWVEQERAPQPGPPEAGPGLSRAGRWRIPALETPGQEVPPPAQPPAQPPGEFTRQFGAPPAPEDAPPPPPAPQRGPGEFTRLFRATLGEKATEPAPKRAEATAKTPPPARDTPVTGAPERPVPSAPPAPTVTPPAPEERPAAGAFTKMFGQPTAGAMPSHEDMPVPTPSGTPGEFTRYFQQPPGSPLGPEAGREPDSQEFERMFEQSGSAKPSLPEVSPQQPPGPGAREPGEFTRLFQAYRMPPGQAPSAPGPPAPPPPDLPGWTQSPSPAASGPEIAASPKPSRSPAGSSGGPGEFTRQFGTPGESGGAAPGPMSPPPPVRGQGATGVFSSQRATPQQAPPPAAGPGEYTRLFGPAAGSFDSPEAPTPGTAAPQAAATPQLGQAPMGQIPMGQVPAPRMPPAPPMALPQVAVPQAAAAVPKAKPSYLPLILIGAVVLLATLALLLYFLLKK